MTPTARGFWEKIFGHFVLPGSGSEAGSRRICVRRGNALIASVEGKRGTPAATSAVPVGRGPVGKPTVINNVDVCQRLVHTSERGKDLASKHRQVQGHQGVSPSLPERSAIPVLSRYPWARRCAYYRRHRRRCRIGKEDPCGANGRPSGGGDSGAAFRYPVPTNICSNSVVHGSGA